MRAKLQDGRLVYPPNTSTRPDGTMVVGYAMREDLLVADGWKTVVLAQRPDGPLWVESYQEQATEIRQVWTEREKTDAEKEQDAQETAQQAAAAQWQAEHTAKVQALRDAYAGATAQLCQLAGIPVVRVLDMAHIQPAVMPLLTGPNAGIVNGLLILLTNIEGKLTREDKCDALNRV
jgi:hypothetical protein